LPYSPKLVEEAFSEVRIQDCEYGAPAAERPEPDPPIHRRDGRAQDAVVVNKYSQSRIRAKSRKIPKALKTGRSHRSTVEEVKETA